MLLTIDESGSKIARNSVYDCHLSPVRQKTLFLMIFNLHSSKECIGSVVECLTRKGGAGGSSLTNRLLCVRGQEH